MKGNSSKPKTISYDTNLAHNIFIKPFKQKNSSPKAAI